MPFNLFRRKKEIKQETPATPNQEELKPVTPTPAITTEEAQPEAAPEKESTTEPIVPMPSQEPVENPKEELKKAPEPIVQETLAAPEGQNKTYLKAMPLKELTDLENVKNEVKNGNIIILRITPLASKSIEDVKTAVNELFQFAESIGGDIARLGEERVVICPKTVRIWREKTPAPVASANQPLPTAA